MPLGWEKSNLNVSTVPTGDKRFTIVSALFEISNVFKVL